MKQVFIKEGRVVVEDVPAPACGDNEVLVANAFSLISPGTELASIKSRKESLITLALKRPDLRKKAIEMAKKQGFKKVLDVAHSKLSKPATLGYSCAGIVVEVGRNVKHVQPGDKVACGGAGYANHADFVVVPKNLVVRVPDNVTLEEATFATVGAIALQGVRRANPTIGESMAVIGLGLLGLLTVQILRANGCNVIGFDINDSRVNLAKRLGCDEAYNSTKSDPVRKVMRFTNNIGADAIIITAAAKTDVIVKQALEMARKKGRVVVVGDVPMNLPRSPFYEKELDFLISCSYGPGRYDKEYEEKGIDYPLAYVRWTEQRNMEAFINLLSKGLVSVKPLISGVFDIDEAEEAYKALESAKGITYLFKYKSLRIQKEKKVKIKGRAKKTKGKVRLGVIGAGSYAQMHILPNLKKIDAFELVGIATKTPASAKQVAEKYGFEYATADWREIVEDKSIDAVIIATRHDLHATIAIEAAKNGKDVFVEKPLALNERDMKKAINAVKKNGVNLIVGFNRRYAPFSQKVREVLDQLDGEVMINMVVNASRLPLDHWVYDEKQGGGRIIGEACHFFDLANFFAGSCRFVDLKASSLNSSLPDYLSEDNVNVHVSYDNGSLASITYNSIGSKSFPKENILVFKAGNAARITDFMELEIYGKGVKKEKLKMQDKGQYNQFLHVAEVFSGKAEPKLTLEEIEAATRMTFMVVEQIKHL